MITVICSDEWGEILIEQSCKTNAANLTLKVLGQQLIHWDTFKQDNYSTVLGDGGCMVGKVRGSTTSPMPEHQGFKLQ